VISGETLTFLIAILHGLTLGDKIAVQNLKNLVQPVTNVKTFWKNDMSNVRSTEAILEGYKSYTIKPRRSDGQLVIVFQLKTPYVIEDKEFKENSGIRGRLVSEEVFSQSSLENRINNLEKHGHDASYSRGALDALRAAKAQGLSAVLDYPVAERDVRSTLGLN
jgi:hypothetical protein